MLQTGADATGRFLAIVIPNYKRAFTLWDINIKWIVPSEICTTLKNDDPITSSIELAFKS